MGNDTDTFGLPSPEAVKGVVLLDKILDEAGSDETKAYEVVTTMFIMLAGRVASRRPHVARWSYCRSLFDRLAPRIIHHAELIDAALCEAALHGGRHAPAEHGGDDNS